MALTRRHARLRLQQALRAYLGAHADVPWVSLATLSCVPDAAWSREWAPRLAACEPLVPPGADLTWVRHGSSELLVMLNFFYRNGDAVAVPGYRSLAASLTPACTSALCWPPHQRKADSGRALTDPRRSCRFRAWTSPPLTRNRPVHRCPPCAIRAVRDDPHAHPPGKRRPLSDRWAGPSPPHPL
jgi:hypothetical protein